MAADDAAVAATAESNASDQPEEAPTVSEEAPAVVSENAEEDSATIKAAEENPPVEMDVIPATTTVDTVSTREGAKCEKPATSPGAEAAAEELPEPLLEVEEPMLSEEVAEEISNGGVHVILR